LDNNVPYADYDFVSTMVPALQQSAPSTERLSRSVPSKSTAVKRHSSTLEQSGHQSAQKPGRTGKTHGKPIIPTSSTSSTSTSSSSATKGGSSATPSSENQGQPTAVYLSEFLGREIPAGTEIVWKGASRACLQSFQRIGRFVRSLSRRGGDLSVAPAVYYTDTREYAVAWGAYRLPPSGWFKSTFENAIVFEAVLTLAPHNVIRVDLPLDDEQVQQVNSFSITCSD